jgi:hypothetical protein
MLADVAISGDRNVIKKKTEKNLKIQRPHKRNSVHVECESKYDTSNNGVTGTFQNHSHST